jgi:hypothetical protein
MRLVHASCSSCLPQDGSTVVSRWVSDRKRLQRASESLVKMLATWRRRPIGGRDRLDMHTVRFIHCSGCFFAENTVLTSDAEGLLAILNRINPQQQPDQRDAPTSPKVSAASIDDLMQAAHFLVRFVFSSAVRRVMMWWGCTLSSLQYPAARGADAGWIGGPSFVHGLLAGDRQRHHEPVLRCGVSGPIGWESSHSYHYHECYHGSVAGATQFGLPISQQPIGGTEYRRASRLSGSADVRGEQR